MLLFCPVFPVAAMLCCSGSNKKIMQRDIHPGGCGCVPERTELFPGWREPDTGIDNILPVRNVCFPKRFKGFPVADNVVPAMNKAVPVTNKVVPARNKAVPVTDKAVPATNKVVPVTNKVFPVTDKVVPVADNAVPATNKVVPVG